MLNVSIYYTFYCIIQGDRMARGKKPAVSSYDRRRWLEELESGRGITEITRAAGRDIRVVKRHIEMAQEERQIAHARRDFLLDRLEQHQGDLLNEVQRLRRVVSQYPPTQLIPDDPMERRLHDALREHTRRLPLKGLLELYEGAVAEFRQARDNVSNQIGEREAQLVSRLPEEVVTYPWTPALVEALELGMKLDEASGRTHVSEKQGEGMYEISWGSAHLTRSPVSEAMVPIIVEAHKKLLSGAESNRTLFQQHHQRLKELIDLVVEELDVFVIKRLVPGHCRYCPL
jgi:hypothetical protein